MVAAFNKYPLEKHAFRRVRFFWTDPKYAKLLKACPQCFKTRSCLKFTSQFRNFINHKLPAQIIDMILRVLLQRPKVVKAFNRMQRGFDELWLIEFMT